MKKAASLFLVLGMLLCGCSALNEESSPDNIIADDGSYEYNIENDDDIQRTSIDSKTLLLNEQETEDESSVIEGTEDEETENTEEPVSPTVYRTKSGEKYHREGCYYLKSRIETTVDKAKSMGLKPCSKCHPPQ